MLEYEVIDIDINGGNPGLRLKNRLNTLAEMGWKMIHASTYTAGSSRTPYITVILERPKP